MNNIAIIIAGGIGARMGQGIPKQFIEVNGKPIIIYTLEAFQRNPDITAIEIVCRDAWKDVLLTYVKKFCIDKLENIVSSGDNGQDSIRNGLNDVALRYNAKNDIVLVHDAVRPMITDDVIKDNIRICRKYGNAVAVVPCTTAVIKTFDYLTSYEQISRENLRITQTPQAFFVNDFVDAHREALEKGITNSVSSCTMYIELGKRVFMSKGSEKNIKLTTVEDLDLFRALLLIQDSK